MEKVAFFEKKISLTPRELNKVKNTTTEDLLLQKAKEQYEGKCSENGFILPGSIKLISRSMGYFEPARFTGDAVYYVKLEANIIYPADGIKITGEVIRKNKMGLYVVHRDAIRIQIPRDLHLGSEEYEAVQIGDIVEVELKRSKFQINDSYILASGLFLRNTSTDTTSFNNIEKEESLYSYSNELQNETRNEGGETENEGDETENEGDETENEGDETENEGDEN